MMDIANGHFGCVGHATRQGKFDRFEMVELVELVKDQERLGQKVSD